MNKNLLTAQMIVKNEDQWIWYAIASVIDYVSGFLIYDTGSKDRTVSIIKTFPKNKIAFEEKGEVTNEQIAKLRQQQMERTKTPWFLIIDGDEVWPKNSIEALYKTIENADNSKIGVVVRVRICLGDILHYQDEEAGKYLIAGRKGHFNIRAYRKIKSYFWQGAYPNEAYVSRDGIPIQKKENQLTILDKYYWHLRHLKRSSKIPNKKRKLELGKKIDKKELPEVFNLKPPEIVPSPWITYSLLEKTVATLATPLRKLKRNLL